eukprot:15328028-Ditylum_brightwellii.AAC.2
MAKYLCTILNKLGITQHGPAMIYKDNVVAIMMVFHIDISYFALQEWVQEGNVKLAHIRGVANPAYALAKALGWTLHHCHVTQMMGHKGNVYTRMH